MQPDQVPVRPRRRIQSSAQEGHVTAGHSVGSKGKASGERVRSLSIPAEPCPTDPAYVSVGLGMTENLGNFESLRLDVRISLPCGTTDKDIEECAKRCGDLAAKFIEEERQKAMGTEGVTA